MICACAGWNVSSYGQYCRLDVLWQGAEHTEKVKVELQLNCVVHTCTGIGLWNSMRHTAPLDLIVHARVLRAALADGEADAVLLP